MLYTVAFWKGATERSVKTFAETLLTLISAEQVGVVRIGTFDWPAMLSISFMAALASVLMSIANPEFVAGRDAVAEAKARAAEAAATAAVDAAATVTAACSGEVVAEPDVEDAGMVDTVPPRRVAYPDVDGEPTGDSTLPVGWDK